MVGWLNGSVEMTLLRSHVMGCQQFYSRKGTNEVLENNTMGFQEND
jgi:hypothetical protein